METTINTQSKNIIWFHDFPSGRFANSAFQFLFIKYLEQLVDCQIIVGHFHRLPDELPWQLFDLPDHHKLLTEDIRQSVHEVLVLGINRAESPTNDVDIIRAHFEKHPGTILAVEGFFQYDTNWIKSIPDYFCSFQNYLSLSEKNTPFQKILAAYQIQLKAFANQNYMIAIHVRRGDYLNFTDAEQRAKEIFFPPLLDSIVEAIRSYVALNRIKNPMIYVASDDLPFCKDYFASKNITINTSEALLPVEHRTDTNQLMVDLAALATSRLLIASNSSFSLLASLLNDSSRVFWRQSNLGDVVSFDPWSTQILYGL